MAADDLYAEISEDLRQQELEKFWKENQSFIIFGIVGAIVLTAALSWWRGYTLTRNQTATAHLQSAIASADPGQILDYAAHSETKNHAFLARFAAARLHVGRQEFEAAATLYADLEKDRKTPKLWRDLATLSRIGLMIEKEEVTKLQTELKPLTVADNPWRFSAREMEAWLNLRRGEKEKASALLALLAEDTTVPQTLRGRAATLRDAIAGEDVLNTGDQK